MGAGPTRAHSSPGATVLGLPRMGRDRELKFALEAHWRGELDGAALEAVGAATRAQSIGRAIDAGLDTIPSGDQSYYDHILDTALMLGALPPRIADRGWSGLELEFALARGTADSTPLEMTKWFDTNYHYLVPEIGRSMDFRLDPARQLARLAEARARGAAARPVLVGPYTFLRLAKPAETGAVPLEHIDALIPLYQDLLAQLAAAGAVGVQIDEPALALEPDGAQRDAARRALTALAASPTPITLTTYFAGIASEMAWVRELPVHRLHLDLVRAPRQLEDALAGDLAADGLSLGLVDGRNVWRTDLDTARSIAQTAIDRLGADRVDIAASCSLLHVPYSAARETQIAAEVHSWLAFADEKIDELVVVRDALAAPDRADAMLAPARRLQHSRRTSALTNDPAVAARLDQTLAGPPPVRPAFDTRYPAQVEALGLPELPTTTIGSFPQTDDLRDARRRHREGHLDDAAYEAILVQSIRETIARQEQLDLDVLVHGEPERNDMVEYFGERLRGFAFSRHGWVQSYGSRCVKPPLIYGDVSRPAPMTVRWWQIAQQATDRPVKGMLTGPVTILQWSFVRDDVPRSQVTNQIALAIRDEVLDLEAAGCRVIQVDEPGLREGLPLHDADRSEYLRWSVDAFRLATLAVADRTQIHTHMCYADFDEIVDDVARLDADVISLEASRSAMEPLDAFAHYPNAIGPGVYDIHSPRVPDTDEIERLLALAEARIDRRRLWVNPDCGLKTRGWDQVTPALGHLVEAARRRRAEVAPA